MITFDSSFSSEENHERIWAVLIIPLIKPNHRNAEDILIIKTKDFFDEYRGMYKTRHMIER